MEKIINEDFSFFDDVRKNTPKHIDIYVEKAMDIIDRIYEIMEQKGLSQKDIADALNKKEPEISKWLSGIHNYTLKTIAKLEEALGEEIIVTSVNLKNDNTKRLHMSENTSCKILKTAASVHSNSGKVIPFRKMETFDFSEHKELCAS